MMQALYLARVRGRKVVLVEQQAAVGGLFSGVATPWGKVDQGLLTLPETGHAAWDDLFFEILPREQWHLLEGVRRDIVGNIFAGRVDQGSMYPDLRSLPAEDYLRCVGEMFSAVRPDPPGWADVPHLAAYFESRFGPCAVRKVFAPMAQKLWRQPLEQLSPWAARMVYLSRVVTHDARTSLALKASPALDAVIGFPEQLAFPEAMWSSRRKSFYPRRYGLHHVIEGLSHALARHGAQWVTSTKVVRLETEGAQVTAVQTLDTASGTQRRVEAAAVLWTAPQFELARLLELRGAPPPDAPLPHRVVYLFLDRPPCMGELYGLWSYDPGDAMVRVSNPAAYCPDAASSGHYPVCVEMHVADPALPDADALAQAEQQLRMRGLLDAACVVIGGAVLPGGRGFFPPTLANCAAIAAQRRAIEEQGLANVFLSTQDLSAGLFFMSDILNASQARLDAL
jgi:protoporphyrinogen oxidase